MRQNRRGFLDLDDIGKALGCFATLIFLIGAGVGIAGLYLYGWVASNLSITWGTP